MTHQEVDSIAELIVNSIKAALAPVSARIDRLEQAGGGGNGAVAKTVAIVPALKSLEGMTADGFAGLITTSIGLVVKPLAARIAKLEEHAKAAAANQQVEERLKALEVRPSLEYRGVWAEDVQYLPGHTITFDGSAWVCQLPSKGHRPGSSNHFQLAVKRGRDGRR